MKQVILVASATLALCPWLEGQQTIAVEPGVLYQGAVYQKGVALNVEGPVTRELGTAVTGSPFSATQEQHNLQVLADGTRIEQTESSQVTRDSQGRTRNESSHAAGESPAVVTIQDPVSGTSTILNTATKTANQLALPRLARAYTSARAALALDEAKRDAEVRRNVAAVSGAVPGVAGAVRLMTTSGVDAGTGLGSAFNVVVDASKARGATPVLEDLGVQTINGVPAKGTRTTLTIPAGNIGNDRPIQVVNERWYSDDLHMVVKSSNSDPRFGTTEFNLKNIVRAEPDPTLFQIPADFTTAKPAAVTAASVP
jgi:hypothetical protein